jgi:DNA-binding response OmpR family regulator
VVARAVLIADSDAQRAKRVEQACAARGFQARTAPHGAAALELALTDVPDVLVAPFELPLIDAPKLADILHTNPRTAGIRFLLLGRRRPGMSQPGVGDEIAPADLEPAEVAARVEAMLSRLARLDEVGQVDEDAEVEGKLSKISLADLLQLFNQNGKTGTLELLRRDASGRAEKGVVHLDRGNIVQATTGAVEGEKALFRLLAWSDGAFAFAPRRIDVAPVIQKPLRALLMEGMRQLDETRRLDAALPPLDAHVALRVKSADLPNMVHPQTQEVLLLLEIYSRVQDVVDHCSFADYQVLRTLHTLIERGMVELRRGPQLSPGIGAHGLFAPAQARRLHDWLDAGRPRGAPARDAKLLIASVGPGATSDFVRLLRGVPGVRLEGAFAGGAFSPHDLAIMARVPVDGELGIELVHLPIDPSYAPLWPLAGHGALGSIFLLEGSVAEASAAVEPALATLRSLPRARVFHAILLRKGERALPDELRQNLDLIDEASLFLVPLESGKPPVEILRPLLARILP